MSSAVLNWTAIFGPTKIVKCIAKDKITMKNITVKVTPRNETNSKISGFRIVI